MANCIQCGRQLPALTFGKKICQWCVQHEAAQRGEAEEDAVQPVMAAPWVRRESSVNLTQIILGANVMVFIAMVIASGPSLDFTGQVMVHFGANFGPYTLSGQWWRLVTYMFLHGGIFHIAINMWCLWDLGALCESLYGRWTYAALYLITGVAAGLTSLAWNTGVMSVGASGAIFGLAGALIASFSLGEFSLSGIDMKGTLRSLLFFCAFSLFFGRVVDGIDNAAHIGGLVSGLIFGTLIARAAPAQDKPLQRAGVLLFMVLLVGGSGLAVHRWRGYGLAVSAQDRQANIDRIISSLQSKVKRNPQDVAAHYALAQAYFGNRQFSKGEGELERVLELQPQNTQALMDLGVAYLREERAKEAQAEFTKLVTLEPNNAKAHFGLGMALADQGDHEKAITEYQAALRIEPQASDAYYRTGVSQAYLKQYDEAIASFLKERETNGDDAELESALADAYEAKGMTQKAQEARNLAAQFTTAQPR
ncbi:MAG TPA: rhomboid family intramembrane serine protease [Candidatus Sulfotelmatobacter sp.]|jgi:rhomboid protease GluP